MSLRRSINILLILLTRLTTAISFSLARDRMRIEICETGEYKLEEIKKYIKTCGFTFVTRRHNRNCSTVEMHFAYLKTLPHEVQCLPIASQKITKKKTKIFLNTKRLLIRGHENPGGTSSPTHSHQHVSQYA